MLSILANLFDSLHRDQLHIITKRRGWRENHRANETMTLKEALPFQPPVLTPSLKLSAAAPQRALSVSQAAITWMMFCRELLFSVDKAC